MVYGLILKWLFLILEITTWSVDKLANELIELIDRLFYPVSKLSKASKGDTLPCIGSYIGLVIRNEPK